MLVYAGTSGFSFKEWRGSFYPDDLPAAEMLAYYAARLTAVEINNTFYRLPKPDLLESWAAKVPHQFKFTLKASRRITHFKRLKDAGDETLYLLETASVLGPRLGAVLFQLPPGFAKDVDRLASFMAVLPERTPAAFEFRHGSWLDDDVYGLLREHNAALCIADTDEDAEPQVVVTADWAYLRLRRASYSAADLERWAARIEGQPWHNVFAFFKHEEAGTGPRLASQFLTITGHAGDGPPQAS
jgi:uncharacterized protein YecE (DUF72 family)